MYNGWSNRETWLMNLNLQNTEGSYDLCEQEAAYKARKASGSEEYFWECLAVSLEEVGRVCSENGILPDFDGNHDREDMTKVNWLEIASKYELEDYL